MLYFKYIILNITINYFYKNSIEKNENLNLESNLTKTTAISGIYIYIYIYT